MYKISSIPGMYSRKLITANQAAALVKKNFRIHYGTGLGVPQDIDAAFDKSEQRRIAVISDQPDTSGGNDRNDTEIGHELRHH